MGEAEQLLLFQMPKTEIEQVREKIDDISKKMDNTRRSLYGRHADLSADILSLQVRMDMYDMHLMNMDKYLKTRG